MADQLATPVDLASALQSDLDTATATLWIECATAVVQSAAGQRIVQVIDDTVEFDLDGYDYGRYLDLPERPVTAVTSVLIGATAVTNYVLGKGRSRLWRACGWRSGLTAYLDEPSTATVTYTHGYPVGHQKRQLGRSAVLGLAKGVYSNAGGVTSEKIDDYAVVYEAMSARMEASPFLAAALKKQYGRPVGSLRLIAAAG